MTWDPANLEIHSVTATKPVTDAQSDVTLEIEGVGFGPKGKMFGVLVRPGETASRDTTIICNDVATTYQDRKATARICPRKKVAGSYDLVMWLAPPPHVVAEGNQEVPDIPVSDIAVLKNAITVEKEL